MCRRLTTTNTAGEFTLAFAGHPAGRQLLVVDWCRPGYELSGTGRSDLNTANVLPSPVTTPPLIFATAVTVEPCGHDHVDEWCDRPCDRRDSTWPGEECWMARPIRGG